MADGLAPATDFMLQELGAGGVANERSLTLRDRFLPYRPIKIGGKQRAEFTWYPGHPNAVVQMLGPEENTIQLNGWWKDRFFDKTSVEATGLSTSLTTIADLIALVDSMRLTGRRIRLSWSGLQRYGHITSFQQTWHNPHDCEWEIEFAVSALSAAVAVSPTAAPPTPADIASSTEQDANNLVAEAGSLALTPDPDRKLTLQENFFKKLNDFNETVIGGANGLINNAYGYATGVFTATQAIRNTVSGLAGIISGTATTFGDIADTAISEVYSFNFWGDQDSAPFGIQLAANNLRNVYKTTARQTLNSCAYFRQQMALQEAAASTQVQIYVATAGMDLRDVSIIYYNNANYWQQLMQYNNLTSSRLTAGQQIYIPSLSVLTSQGVGA